MDEILSVMSGVSVSTHHNNPHAEHPRFSLYKAKPTSSSQEERRQTILEARKKSRYDLLSHLRNVEEDGASSSDLSENEMEYEEVQQCYSRPKKFRNFLMLSEWLVDIPEDFTTTFLAVPCPVGKRSLVVAARGRTRAYTKSGLMVNQFPSMLPGGNYQTCKRGYAILDCIWSESNKTFYVLDLVMWMNQTILECETLFRFEWLKSRLLEEAPESQYVGKLNPLRFERVPYYTCSQDSLQKMISEPMPFSVPLDGVLFYHSETHYTHGPTPLVGWLKAFMFPEILGVPVPECMLSERPTKYVNLPTHIQYAKDLKKSKSEKMEVSQSKPKPKSKKKHQMEVSEEISQ